MTDYTAHDIVMNAAQKKPHEVVKAVEFMMTNKIADFIERHRIEVASSLFNKGNDSSDETTETLPDDEIELSDEDFEEFSDTDEEENGEDENA